MSNEPMKIPVNYAEASETLRKLLSLKGSPVAIRFATSREDIPAGMEELDKKRLTRNLPGDRRSFSCYVYAHIKI